MDQFVHYTHAASGIIIALTGLLQIILPKHGPKHRLIGKIYFFSWFGVVITGSIMGAFLITLFGIFGLYMAITGVRYAQRKSIVATIFDKIIIYIGMLSSLFIWLFAAYLAYYEIWVFAIISAVFGYLFSNTTIEDLRCSILGQEIRKISGHKMEWYLEHLTRMYISYLAAMTAFSVIQNLFKHPLANWLAPIGIGIVLITITRKKYEKQYNIE
ncbi:MAG: hypothetical protein GY810_25615 [Aureispira sp.]|nr:hypothetical protein [Aureispira sp.]